jgi:hypothetical protein
MFHANIFKMCYAYDFYNVLSTIYTSDRVLKEKFVFLDSTKRRRKSYEKFALE